MAITPLELKTAHEASVYLLDDGQLLIIGKRATTILPQPLADDEGAIIVPPAYLHCIPARAI